VPATNLVTRRPFSYLHEDAGDLAHHHAAEVIAIGQIIAQGRRTIVGKVQQRRHEPDVRRPMLWRLAASK